MLVNLKRHLPLLGIKIGCLHIWSTLSNISFWSLPCLSKPTIIKSSAILNTLCIPLKSSPVFFWNMPLAGDALNDNCMHLYLPIGQQNFVKCGDSVKFEIIVAWFVSINVRYLTLASYSRISLNIGSPWPGLISTLLSMARSRQNYTLPLVLGTSTKLLHHSNILPIPRCTFICYFCCVSSSSFRGS